MTFFAQIAQLPKLPKSLKIEPYTWDDATL